MKSKISEEEIIKNYQKQAEEILHEMMQILRLAQQKRDEEKYTKMIEEIKNHATN